ncbi:MAG: cell wall hydrolase [Sphingomonas sp.]|uniref:cell wall hydrolase n=1 Tax=Sphingomonas sp. TaxID=28214 RepID=UPI001B15E359|nr:cell wall hydrolase [Sphingomonas sp.]MBO9623236.1 cell wall hydrolase [Sphingomonas sp.]
MQAPHAELITPAPEPRRNLVLRLILGLIALAAIVVPALIVINAPRTVVHKRPPVVISKRVVPKAELPPVEPVKLQQVAPEDAREINAAIPFSSAPNPAARAFRLYGAVDSQARAVDCLAAAVYYEAGDDAVGQRAVAQVVINRVRHPAFPKTVCGVVFQGSERSTGCQFTFTCDGALLRYSPSPAAWQRAREVARLALNGSVYKAVGHATHYHTDWVVPYWSSSLEKITAVHTHLFFRWAGWWGTPPAFDRGYIAAEPNVPKMARLSPAHHDDGSTAIEAALEGDGSIIDPATIPDSAVPKAAGTGLDANHFLVTLSRSMNPDAFAALAIKTCGERLYCKFMAWTDAKQTPAKLPATPAQSAAMSFSYLRDTAQGYAKALWNCQQFKRPSPLQCMRVQPPVVSLAPPSAAAAPAPGTVQPTEPGPAALSGVRRKGDPAPATAKPAVSFTLPAPKPISTPAPDAR